MKYTPQTVREVKTLLARGLLYKDISKKTKMGINSVAYYARKVGTRKKILTKAILTKTTTTPKGITPANVIAILHENMAIATKLLETVSKQLQ